MNNSYLVRLSVAGFLATACILESQTAFSADKAKTAEATPAAAAAKAKTAPNTNFTTRVHTKISKDAEPEFLRLVGGRKNAAEESRVVRRLLREKQAMLDKVEKDLAAGYTVRKDRNYSYDGSTKTIYEIESQPSGTNTTDKAGAAVKKGDPSNEKKKVHMILDSKEKADKFIQMTAAKQTIVLTIRVLAMLEKEKENELARLATALMDKFSMSRDRSYEYDPKTGTLYEMIPVPTTGKEAGK